MAEQLTGAFHDATLLVSAVQDRIPIRELFVSTSHIQRCSVYEKISLDSNLGNILLLALSVLQKPLKLMHLWDKNVSDVSLRAAHEKRIWN